MPSENTTRDLLAVLTPALDAFRSAVTDAAEALRTQLDAQRPANGSTTRVADELGAFAAGRIDPSRFAELLDRRPPMDDRALSLLERARSELATIAAAGDAPFRVSVPADGDLVAEIGAALAVAGRAFCAARVAELVRMGRTKEAAQEDFVAGLPFSRWTRGELRIAPPLLVELDGGDLQAGGLAAFLDGAQKIVLVVRAPAPAAPLARLITPGVFVMQTCDPADVAKLAKIEGPAIVALVPEGCATFTHDPAAGDTLAARLSVTTLPDEVPAQRVGRASAFQQAEELGWLRMLVNTTKPAAAPPLADTVVASEPEATEPVPDGAGPTDTDRLAAWLLQQADLTAIA